MVTKRSRKALIWIAVAVLLSLNLPLSVESTPNLEHHKKHQGETRCMERERESLLRFKQQLTDEHGALSSWGIEDHQKECCNWLGITCSNTTGHVTGMLLQAHWSATSFYKFGGKISPALLDLHHLNYLDLSQNDFGGARIPDFIGSITSLEYLDLGFSNFSGRIPPQLGNLTNLRILHLHNNFLWSDNLYWLSDLPSLTHLNLSRSNISDTNWLQHTLLNLPSLHTLQLHWCMLTDVVTPSANLFVNSSSSFLSHLDLSVNELTSSTFGWLFNISTSLVYVDLSINKLDGSFPDAFSKLKFLEELDLSDNMLEDGIPKSLGNLSRLQSLDLGDNNFTGPVPDLGACSQLRSLYLSFNRLTGSLPASLGQLSKLEDLYIRDNSLKGVITEAHFMELHTLRNLDLAFNSLTFDLSPDWIPPFHLVWIDLVSCQMARGSFPTWLRTQNDIEYLDISLAGISDEVPRWLWNKVRYLNLSHNQIWGSIPDLSSNSSVIMLDVGSNNLSGPVPFLSPDIQGFHLSFNMFSGSISSICPYAACGLQWLDISHNQLEGALPSDWANFKELMVLNMNYNNLSGKIPDSLGFLSNLQTLHLRGNNFSGELPTTLKNCRLLQQIDIGENRFTGNIPPWLGENHTSLVFLSLARNMFYGDIPPQICKLTQIQLLDLSHNNLTGKIPKCFDNFIPLVDKNRTTITYIFVPVMAFTFYMDYALVQWKGQKAEYNKILGLLKLIDLSSNKLVGSIPESFSNLKGLISLNLSKNSLTGNIIPSIGEMESLETLDLSSNQLSGKMPIGLAQLNSLAVLDLTNNDLTGEIPQGNQLQSFDPSYYAGNYRLCGSPLPLCINTSITMAQGNDDINEIDGGGLTRLSSTQEFCITLALGFIIGFWGVVGSLVLKRSWRNTYFNFFDAVGNWLYVTAHVFLNKFRRS